MIYLDLVVDYIKGYSFKRVKHNYIDASSFSLKLCQVMSFHCTSEILTLIAVVEAKLTFKYSAKQNQFDV